MSAAVRAALAAAANTVTGVDVSPYYRQDTKAGSGIVQLDRVDFPNAFGGVAHWSVLVLLPTDLKAAQERADELLPALYAALSTELAVTSATFGTTQIESSSGQPCVLISGHRALED